MSLAMHAIDTRTGDLSAHVRVGAAVFFVRWTYAAGEVVLLAVVHKSGPGGIDTETIARLRREVRGTVFTDDLTDRGGF